MPRPVFLFDFDRNYTFIPTDDGLWSVDFEARADEVRVLKQPRCVCMTPRGMFQGSVVKLEKGKGPPNQGRFQYHLQVRRFAT